MWQWCWLPPQYDVDQPRLVTPHLPVQPTALAIEGHNLIIATHQTNQPPVHFTAMNWSVLRWNSQVNYEPHWGDSNMLQYTPKWFSLDIVPPSAKCLVTAFISARCTCQGESRWLAFGVIFFIMHLRAMPFSKFDTFKQLACWVNDENRTWASWYMGQLLLGHNCAA